jgi:parallel beta-helix repeat protein
MSRWSKLQSRPAFIWIALLTCLAGARVTWATTYYIAPDGNDLADGKSPDHPWQTLLRASAQSLAGGDELLLRRGGVWRETFTITSDGDPARPIIFSAYGQGERPCIDGGDPIDPSKFARTDSVSVFRAPVDFKLETVWDDVGPPLIEAKSRAEVSANEGDFFCDGAWLYIHPTAGRDPRSGQVHFEIPDREVCVDIRRSHIALRSIAICHAGRPDRGAVTAWADHDLAGIELRNCDISYNRGRGVWFCGPPTNSIHDVLIADNDFRENDASGVLLVLADGAQIRGNHFTGNCRLPIEPWQAAIRLWSGGIRNMLVSDNTVTDQRWGHTLDSSMGIHCDETGDRVTIRGNLIRDADQSGIEVENTRGVTVEKNIVIDCNIGILINRAGHDHIIRANTIVDSRAQAISLQGWLAHGVDAGPEITVDGRLLTHNLIENNLTIGSRLGELKAINGGQRIDGPLGNIFRENDFGPERPGFIEWGDRMLDRYAQWPIPGGASHDK